MATLASCATVQRVAEAPRALPPPVTASVSHAGASAYASDGPTVERAAQVAGAPAVHELIVADAEGLSAHLLDGSSKRIVSPGPTRHPRWFDARSVLSLAVVSGHDLSGGGRIEQISLLDGTRRVLAALPPFACAPTLRSSAEEPRASAQPAAGAAPAEPVVLDVQTTSDFQVDADKRVACLDLMDRNTNLATLGMRVRVDLSSGQVTRWMTLGAEDCQLPADIVAGVPAEDDVCNTVMRYDPPPAPSAAQFPYDFDNERVTLSEASGKVTRKLTLEGYEVESASPSGRWLLLGGDPEEGDFTYRRLVLLDRQTGVLFAVQGAAGAFPSALKAHGKRVRTPIRDAPLRQYEADVRWLGDSAEGELLVVDDLLVRPGERAFSVEGELAY